MNLIISKAALDDLDQAYAFYESQALGLGAYFEDTICAEIESLRLYAGVHRKVFEYHRLLSGRFPYAIYYDVTGEDIRVRAILDCRRKPDLLKGRLK